MLRRIFSLSNGALLVALSLSTIAAWYSIIGLTAIFAGAVVPIIIMGTALEFAKITTTVWLRKYWYRCSMVMKFYLVPAVVLLALLTSMGIFGFLSKAHLDQNIGTGDVQARVSLLDEKIATQRETIKSSKAMLAQMDQQVNDIMTKGDSEKSVERSVIIRKQQQKERAGLQKDIEIANKEIQKLNEERAPIASEMRKVEAEVGPIKYIAALIYGDNADQNMLEAAVRWVIILLVSVFDPLAIMLVLAANQSKDWDTEEEKEETDWQERTDELLEIFEEDTPDPYVADVGEKPTVEELAVTEEEDEAFDSIVAINEPEEIITDEQLDLSRAIAYGSEPRDIVASTPSSDGVLIKPLEGKEAYELLKSIGIFNEDGKLAYEYGGEEPEDDGVDEAKFLEDFDANLAKGHEAPKFDIDNMTVDSTIAVNEVPVVVQDMERPGDYITPPVVEDDTPNFEGFKDGKTGEWVQTGPAFHPETKPEVVAPQFRRLDNGDYVEFEGKRMHERVLKGLRPDLFAIQVDEPNVPTVSFGDIFPGTAVMGDVYTRIDTVPNRVFKYTGSKGIEVPRETTDTYLTNSGYIQHLIEKLSTGEYDPDNLTAMESDAIAEYIKSPNQNA